VNSPLLDAGKRWTFEYHPSKTEKRRGSEAPWLMFEQGQGKNRRKRRKSEGEGSITKIKGSEPSGLTRFNRGGGCGSQDKLPINR